jgi:integrase/recombinase XerD
MKKEEKAFVGEYKELLESFIQQKRVLGYTYDTTRYHLYLFSHCTLNFKIENKTLSKELVLSWTARRKNESVNTWEHRASDLRQFALYLQNKGYDVYYPQKGRKLRRNEYIPYIFTHKEIERFMRIVDSVSPHPRSNKDRNYPLLFRLLYCCGLRISEALHLKILDVDVKKGILLIKESKFNKDRMIPLSEPLACMCARYHALFNRNNDPNDYYFRNKSGTALRRDQVYQVFRKLQWKAEISHGGKGKGPRLHDLRHTFCVHTLARLVQKGIDLYVALPILSVYIGHDSVGATQRYVRLTAEIYPELIEKVSQTCAYVLPEVPTDETD